MKLKPIKLYSMAFLATPLRKLESKTKKSRKLSNSSILPDHIGFYKIIGKSAAFFLITILKRIMI